MRESLGANKENMLVRPVGKRFEALMLDFMREDFWIDTLNRRI